MFRGLGRSECWDAGALRVGRTHVLPLLSDEGAVAQEVLERAAVDVGPGGRALPCDLQTPHVIGQGRGHHALRGVWLH